MNIREMTETDYDQVYQLWLSCAGMGLNDLDDSKEGIARFLQRNHQTCLGAVENQTIIGAILVGSDGRRAYNLSYSCSSELSQERDCSAVA